MNINAFLQKDYENETSFRPKKTNPIQSQFQYKNSWPKAWISDKMHKFIIDKL
jgi:hypothetical protein